MPPTAEPENSASCLGVDDLLEVYREHLIAMDRKQLPDQIYRFWVLCEAVAPSDPYSIFALAHSAELGDSVAKAKLESAFGPAREHDLRDFWGVMAELRRHGFGQPYPPDPVNQAVQGKPTHMRTVFLIALLERACSIAPVETYLANKVLDSIAALVAPWQETRLESEESLGQAAIRCIPRAPTDWMRGTLARIFSSAVSIDAVAGSLHDPVVAQALRWEVEEIEGRLSSPLPWEGAASPESVALLQEWIRWVRAT